MTSDNEIFSELSRILTYFIMGVNVRNNYGNMGTSWVWSHMQIHVALQQRGWS